MLLLFPCRRRQCPAAEPRPGELPRLRDQRRGGDLRRKPRRQRSAEKNIHVTQDAILLYVVWPAIMAILAGNIGAVNFYGV